jgi:DNA-binding response OmpR family regulator
MRLLLVEDNASLAAMLASALRKSGYTVDAAINGALAYASLMANTFDLVVLNLTLPAIDGIEILRRLRSRNNDTPVFILADPEDRDECVRSLDLGADDFLVKPLGIHELEARIRAILRRGKTVRPQLLKHEDLTFDMVSRTAKVRGEPIWLSTRELSLLESLLLNPGQVMPKAALLGHMCGCSDSCRLNLVEVYVHRLRKKLSGSGVLLRTIYGHGYLLTSTA